MDARRERRAVRVPPGVLTLAVTIVAGAVLVQIQEMLPPRWLDAALGGVALAGFAACVRWRPPVLAWCLPVLLAAVAWTAWRADGALQARIPHALEKQDIVVTGRVVDLPQAQDGSTRFDFKVTQARFDGTSVPLRGHVRLSWYATKDRQPPALRPCEAWTLQVRLKRPHGMVNRGGLDFERSALQKGIVATGYVREDAANRVLRTGTCVDGVRAHVAQAIVAALPNDPHAARMLRALIVGDQQALDEHDWRIIRATGIPHLIVISGFHIGIAGVVGAWLARGLWWLLPSLALRVARPVAEAVVAFPAALMYGALAGFGLPVVRSMLMVAVVVGWRLMRRGGGFGEGFGLALAAILIADPLAVLSAGFWLSFAGVAFLVFTLTRDAGWRRWFKELGFSPWFMAVALLPLTAWFFGQASLVQPVSTLVAAPVISFVLVPLDLVSACLLLAWPAAGAWSLHADAAVADALWWFLTRVEAWPPALQYLKETSLLAFALALLGVVWLLLPRGAPARVLGAILLLPLVWPRTTLPEAGAFRATVIDVGQGLSVLVRTRNHALLFDTGARYPSGFDLGEAVVVPTLHALGVSHLDALLISHGDSDHAGGATAVAAAYPDTSVWGGEPARGPIAMSQCHAGQHWAWDGVDFLAVFPHLPITTKHNNDAGCVLLVTGRSGRLLLPADTSSRVEPEIARAIPAGAPLVLVVPHHGSKTSSSPAYLEALRPRFAVVSTGYLNAYHHPATSIVARYAALGIPVLDTADSGAVAVAFPVDGSPHVVARERIRQARYWRERGHAPDAAPR